MAKEKLVTDSDSSTSKKKRGLPIRRANLFHALLNKKETNYSLSESYKWIKISPKILYRLQAGNVLYEMVFE